MFKRLSEWTLSLAARPAAQWWLGIIAFVESSIFLIPADVIFVPMALARPKRALWYATIATVMSVLGGIAGYYLGALAFEQVARPVLEMLGKYDDFERLHASTDASAILLLLITSGLAHLPPIKVVTILSGAIGVDFWLFVVSAIVARGARFFALGFLIQRYGDDIRHWIEAHAGKAFAAVAVALIGLFVGAKLLLG